ncbi:hypothetical protein [Verrucomicrobium spinosum]|uniref:hypothetical protein n=1 Tax=Verrucomicrobium spinosum TaxID=2736 RepID=UPI00017449DD|nr:hypothetical protein [Verrucomicrobium spinosum]
MKIFDTIKSWFQSAWQTVLETRILDTVADLGGTKEQVEATRQLIVAAEERFAGVEKAGELKDGFVRAGLQELFRELAPYLINALVGIVFGYLRRLGKV